MSFDNVVKPLTFKLENTVELSDVNSFASIFCKPVEDNPQQYYRYLFLIYS